MSGYRQIGGQIRYIKYAQCNPGEILVENGKYVGMEIGKKFGNKQAKFLDESGQIVVMNAVASLSNALDFVEEGTTGIRVVFKETAKVKSGSFEGKDCQVLEVLEKQPEAEAEEKAPEPDDLQL